METNMSFGIKEVSRDIFGNINATYAGAHLTIIQMQL